MMVMYCVIFQNDSTFEMTYMNDRIFMKFRFKNGIRRIPYIVMTHVFERLTIYILSLNKMALGKDQT